MGACMPTGPGPLARLVGDQRDQNKQESNQSRLQSGICACVCLFVCSLHSWNRISENLINIQRGGLIFPILNDWNNGRQI